MVKIIPKKLKNQDWYILLIEELSDIIVETTAVAKETVLEGKWLVGEIIEQAVKDFEKSEIYGSKINSLLAEDLNWSEREIARCRQFYNKYPAENWEKALMKLPEGRNISWHRISNYYLPQPKEGEEKDDKHYISVLVNETEKTIYIKNKYKEYNIKYY